MNPEFYKNLPLFERIKDPDNSNFYLYRHDFKIYYASDISDEWLKKVVEIVENHEGYGINPPKPIVAYLNRPNKFFESLQSKWVVCVIRIPKHAKESDISYLLGIINGLLISGLYKHPNY